MSCCSTDSSSSMSASNSQFLGATVNEFMQFWSLGAEATLNLTTSGGTVKVEFNCTLGQPGVPPTPFLPHLELPLLPLLTDLVTVVRPQGRETALELPATRQLRLRQLIRFPQFQPLLLCLIQQQTSPPLIQWLLQ